MLNTENKNRLIYALGLAIESKFDASDWTKLAYEIDEVDTIEDHNRLIRSLNWGDPDYTQNVIDVLKDIGRNTSQLEKIAEFVSLKEWLQRKRMDLYKELYLDEEPAHLLEDNPLDTEEFDLSKQLKRIYDSLEDDPELAIGTTKEMVETVLKTILKNEIEGNIDDFDLPELIKAVHKNIELIPDDVEDANKAHQTVKRTLNNLGQIVIGIAELRNAYGTGHGKVKNESGLKPYHARLAVNAGVTLAKFLIEVYQDPDNN
ncbi:abortive infection family protein [Sporosarcina saromensis]|uniref:Abortive infection family protein n=1 Tax=Sporosarcina saromensis TaxID=359365 RepID=A0ABU4GAI5_9BACL|nr:abortive infection family protein [Sporosarcina saromensis]MDW0114006.1 abortive infection family protein [Sporosarcina saromensis]